MAIKLFDGSDGSTSSKITRMDDGCMDVLPFFPWDPSPEKWVSLEKKKNGFFCWKLPNLNVNSRKTSDKL